MTYRLGINIEITQVSTFQRYNAPLWVNLLSEKWLAEYWNEKIKSLNCSRMPLMSPGGEAAVSSARLATLILLLSGLSSGVREDTSETVVIQIANIKQPDNCSLFLDRLEVTQLSDYFLQLPKGPNYQMCLLNFLKRRWIIDRENRVFPPNLHFFF